MIGISPSTYYYRPKVDAALREKQDADLKDKIEVIQAEDGVIVQVKPHIDGFAGSDRYHQLGIKRMSGQRQ